jgi:hypoxanthine phosphoribosyltransferase
MSALTNITGPNGKVIRYPFASKTLFTEQEIMNRIKELAVEIAKVYKPVCQSPGSPLVLIGVLKGSYLFLADLARAISDQGVPCIIDFLYVSSYAGTQSTGEVRVMLDLRTMLSGKHALIVEDIVDTAHTLFFLRRLLKTRSPASLKTVTLLDKKNARKIPLTVEFFAFDCPLEFVIGYGMDFNEEYRDIRDVVVLKPEYYEKNKTSKL